MASPSPWRWPWKRTGDAKVGSSYASPSSFNPTINYRLLLVLRKRSSLSTFSAIPSSSCSSSSVYCSSGPNSFRTRLKKSETQTAIPEGCADEVSGLSRAQSPWIQKQSVKSLSGKRALWRRILFASRKVRSVMLLNVITVVYASDVPVLKEVEAITDPAMFTVVRFSLSALPFIPFVLRLQGGVQARNAGIELGLWVSLGYLMQAVGLLTSDAGRASFISMFTVIVVPLIDGMLGTVVPAHTWFGALTSILGVGMLECSGSPPSIGDFLNFLSAVFFGVHMLRTEHISRNTDKENFLSLLGYEMCVVALFSLIWYFIGAWLDGVRVFDPSSWTWTMLWDWMVKFPWIPALYTGAFSTGLCLWVEMAAMCDVSATETAIIYGLEPMWGACFAWFLLGERWGITGWIGAALVLGGSLTMQIFGASSPDSSVKRAKSREKENCVLVSDQQRGLSASPVMVNSRKDPNI